MMRMEVFQSFLDSSALGLGCRQALEVPDDAVDPVAFEFVPQQREVVVGRGSLAVSEHAQLVQMLGGVPEVHDRKRGPEPVGDDKALEKQLHAEVEKAIGKIKG